MVQMSNHQRRDAQGDLFPALTAAEAAKLAAKEKAALRALTAADNRNLGRLDRGDTAAAWLRWRSDYVPPSGAVLRENEAGENQWHTVHTTPPGWQRVRGPRGGSKPSVYIPETTNYEPVGPVMHIPAHCQTVKNIGLWHSLHQAGLPGAECSELVDAYRVPPELAEAATAPKGEGRAAALDFLAGQPAAILAAVVAMRARLVVEAAERERSNAEFYRKHWEETRHYALMVEGENAAEMPARCGIDTLPSAVFGRRDLWWGLAKQARDKGYGAVDMAACAARARTFHRQGLALQRALPPPPPPPTPAEIKAQLAQAKGLRKAERERKTARRAELYAAHNAAYGQHGVRVAA